MSFRPPTLRLKQRPEPWFGGVSAFDAIFAIEESDEIVPDGESRSISISSQIMLGDEQVLCLGSIWHTNVSPRRRDFFLVTAKRSVPTEEPFLVFSPAEQVSPVAYSFDEGHLVHLSGNTALLLTRERNDETGQDMRGYITARVVTVAGDGTFSVGSPTTILSDMLSQPLASNRTVSANINPMALSDSRVALYVRHNHRTTSNATRYQVGHLIAVDISGTSVSVNASDQIHYRETPNESLSDDPPDPTGVSFHPGEDGPSSDTAILPLGSTQLALLVYRDHSLRREGNQWASHPDGGPGEVTRRIWRRRLTAHVVSYQLNAGSFVEGNRETLPHEDFRWTGSDLDRGEDFSHTDALYDQVVRDEAMMASASSYAVRSGQAVLCYQRRYMYEHGEPHIGEERYWRTTWVEELAVTEVRSTGANSLAMSNTMVLASPTDKWQQWNWASVNALEWTGTDTLFGIWYSPNDLQDPWDNYTRDLDTYGAYYESFTVDLSSVPVTAALGSQLATSFQGHPTRTYPHLWGSSSPDYDYEYLWQENYGGQGALFSDGVWFLGYTDIYIWHDEPPLDVSYSGSLGLLIPNWRTDGS